MQLPHEQTVRVPHCGPQVPTELGAQVQNPSLAANGSWKVKESLTEICTSFVAMELCAWLQAVELRPGAMFPYELMNPT